MRNILRQLFVAIAIMVAGAANSQALLDATFSEQSVFDSFSVIDGNSDGQKWFFDDLFYAASCGRDYDADDWLVSPAVMLQEGQEYEFTINYHNYMDGTETFEVKMGTAATIAGLATTVLSTVTVEGSAPAVKTVKFTAPTTGNYYFGIHFNTTGEVFSNNLMVTKVVLEGAADMSIPAAASNLTVTPAANGELKATVAFTTPSQTADGQALSSLTKATVYRDNAVIKTFDNPAVGTQLSYEDTGMSNGKHTYKVVVANETGDSEAVQADAFIGTDIPGAVENLRFSYNYETETATLTWDAPTVGANGGYFNADNLTYNIRRTHQTEPFVTGHTTNTFTEEVGIEFLKEAEIEVAKQWEDVGMPVTVTFVIDGQGLMSYYIKAVNAGGEGAEVQSNSLVIGEQNTLPYAESFAEGKYAHYWRADIRTGRARWSPIPDSRWPQDGDGGMLGINGIEGNETAMAHTGNISLKDANSPVLMFYYRYETPSEGKLNVKVACGDEEFATIKTIDMNEPDNAARYLLATIDLSAYAGKELVKIGFEAALERNVDVLYIDNLRIFDQYANDLAVSISSAPTSLKVGETRYLSACVENLGRNDVATGSYRLNVLVDGHLAGSSLGQSVAVGATRYVNVPITGSIDMPQKGKIYVIADYELDEAKYNNRSESADIKVRWPLYPHVTDLSLNKLANGVELYWSKPAQPRQNDEYVTDSFEDYEDFQRTNFGDWTLVDNDKALTYGIGGFYFPKNSDIMSYMIFTPSEVVNTTTNEKGLTTEPWQTRTGKKMLSSFGAFETASDDWLISPELSGNEQIVSFYAHHHPNAKAGDEFQMYASTTGIETTNFQPIDVEPVKTTSTWQQYEYVLPQGTKYFAIRKVTNDGWALLIDDITFVPDSLGAQTNLQLLGYNIYKNGYKFNDVVLSTPNFTDSNSQEGDIYHVTALYNEGESIYSNPQVNGDITGIENVETETDLNINTTTTAIYDLQGRRLTTLPKRGIVIINGRKVALM